MNVLLIGHACGPGLGSEPGFTWNWAQFLSRKHQVWVIAHPQHKAEVEQYAARRPNANLRFVWVTIRHPLDRWKPERGERGIRMHYMFWLPEAYRRARELCSSASIDIAHHVSWGTIGAPPPLWRLPVPVLWGPLGGGQSTAPHYLPLFGRGRWAERLRNVRIQALRFSGKLRKAAHHSPVIFATNQDTADLLKRAGAAHVRLLLDGGLPPESVPAQLPAPLGAPQAFTVLWAGRLEPRKGLALGLQALAKTDNSRVKLLIAGRGPEQEPLQALAQQLGIAEQVTFLGAVPYARMPELFASASAFLFTSVRDSFGSVVLEAMAYGLPVITLNHQGVGTFLPDAAAVKVEACSIPGAIDGLAKAINRLAASPDICESMRLAAWSFAVDQTWDRRAAQMSDLYESLLPAAAAAARAPDLASPFRS